MTTNSCPKCGVEIAFKQINVEQGVGLCSACGSLSKLSDIANDETLRAAVLERTPSGCSITTLGDETVVRASLRSLSSLAASLFVCLFWNGIVSVFMTIAVAATITNLGGQPPSWMPAPIMNNKPMSPWMTVGLWAFLTPFIAIGLWMLMCVLLNIAGWVTVVIRHDVGKVRTAAGPLGWTRRFNAAAVKSVELEVVRRQEDPNTNKAIRIVADRPLRFGTMLTDERRRWLCAVLHEELVRTRR